jgi:ATP-dependent DNA helicase RecQ
LADVVQQRKMIETSDGDAAHRRRLSSHLDAMLALCETVECRRSQLLAYFGEPGRPCGNCDTCLVPAESWDGTVAAQKVLSAVFRLDRERRQRFGAGHVVDILLGKHTAKVDQFGHHTLSVFGIGTELRDAEWRGVVRQLLAQGLLSVEGDHGTLGLTDHSAGVLYHGREVRFRREPERIRAASRSSGSKRPAVDLPQEAVGVFERLRAWRAATAAEQGIPAYVVFHDATLRQIAILHPDDLHGLGQVSGVGETKLAKYGEQILATLRSG